MKKKLGILCALVLCLCFIFSGCSPKLNLPTGEVSSNGGSVVVIGDYVYYANTFVDYSTLSGDDNTENTTKQNAIYRVKTDEYGYTEKDDEDAILNIEKVYSKIAGFNNSNMFICGNYLYFTSPNVHKEQKTGNDRFDLTTLFRIKLDGTGLKEIYTTKTIQGKFYLVTEENPYLLIFDDSKIVKLELKENLSSPKVLVENVLDTVFPSKYGLINEIYYTTDINEDDKNAGITGNYLYKYNIANNQSTKLGKPTQQTITLVAYEFGNLYYKLLVDGEACYYSQKLTSSWGANVTQWTVVGDVDGTDSISQFTPINENNVVYKYDSKIYLNYEILVSEDANIELVDGDYVYYSNSDGLYKLSYRDKKEQTVAEQKNIQTGSCDIAGEYVYFYAKLDTNTTETYYAFRANIKTPELGEGRVRCECIATVLEEDLEKEE